MWGFDSSAPSLEKRSLSFYGRLRFCLPDRVVAQYLADFGQCEPKCAAFPHFSCALNADDASQFFYDA